MLVINRKQLVDNIPYMFERYKIFRAKQVFQFISGQFISLILSVQYSYYVCPQNLQVEKVINISNCYDIG